MKGSERQSVSDRDRLAPQMSVYERNEPFLRPYVTFAARPNIRSSVLNTDAEGFRISTSPVGPVDAGRWLEVGGGLVLGGSAAFGVGATSDGATLPSRLAFLSGSPQLNLGICAANSLQSVIAAVPFLEAATTVVVLGGVTNVLTSLQSLGLNEIFGPLRFESMLAGLRAAPIAQVVGMTLSEEHMAAESRTRVEMSRQGRAAERLDASGLAARLDDALRRQVRDLRILSRSRRAGARVLFCHAPFSDPSLRDLVQEERDLYDWNAQRRGSGSGTRAFLLGRWEWCGRRLAAACSDLGVQFLDLPAHRFAGWSFIDEWHMTDSGYGQAAEIVWEALRAQPGVPRAVDDGSIREEVS